MGRRIFKKFKPKEYAKFDSTMSYRADKIKCVMAYNKTYGTKFSYIMQLIHKLYEGGFKAFEIGEFVDMKTSGVINALIRMRIKRRLQNGPSRRLNLSPEKVRKILISQRSNRVLALEHHISPTTVCSIKNKKGRWVNI